MEPKPTYQTTTTTRLTGDGYRNIYDGDLVSYILVDRGRGPQAQSVRVRGGAA
jgi:cold shock CspA family protein